MASDAVLEEINLEDYDLALEEHTDDEVVFSDKMREGLSSSTPVFGVPLHQCVDTSSWRRRPGVVPTGLESSSHHFHSPTSPDTDKEMGRISSGSIFDSMRDARSMERVSVFFPLFL